ncbi:MAG TPA: DUF3859 domain-containing protein [Gammaproteobacteria bacterium]|nr:DUF3859 domain-containing protein [Gammaproteobacteria bacterium]
MKQAVLLSVLLMFASEVPAAPQASILEYGYYRFAGDTERLLRPSATSGYVTRGKAQLVKKTQRIPLQKGRLFGFRFRIEGIDRNVGVIPLQLVVKHPEMKKPDGSTSSGYRYRMDLKLTNGMVEDKTGYRLNEDFEMVEGDWSFEFLFMNKPLLKQQFTTYRQEPEQEP